MKTDVVVIGLGYIGLPTAALISSKGFYVHGVDTNQKVIDTVNEGKIHIVEPDLEKAVKFSVDNGFLKADSKAVEANTYLIVVPTPFDKNHNPDISFIQQATRAIIPILKKGDLYIIESTSPVGTTEKMMEFIYEKRPDLTDNLYIAYCPERVLPGNIMHELIYNDRVIGGINDESSEKAMNFYKKFVKGNQYKANSRTAEMCKLVENSSRDVQIAFANELSIICDKANIDVWELIQLANRHPRVTILNPGTGVGGHCIAVDPYFIISGYPNESKIIKYSRDINNQKPLWCLNKIEETISEYFVRNNEYPNVALMGLTFKPDVDDIRESPSLLIAKKMINHKKINSLFLVDPNLKTSKDLDITEIETAIKKSQIIVFLVAHKEFNKLRLTDKIILNFCNSKII